MKKVELIGICGASGSGKTYLIHQLQSHYKEVSISYLSHDNYYKSINHQVKDENGWTNFDRPQALDMVRFEQDVDDLINGKSIELDEYTFNNSLKLSKKIEVPPADILIIEGLYIFHSRVPYSYKVFIDTPLEIAYQRRIERDLRERNYTISDIEYQWKNHFLPSYHQEIHPMKNTCDLVITNEEDKRELFEWLDHRTKYKKKT